MKKIILIIGFYFILSFQLYSQCLPEWLLVKKGIAYDQDDNNPDCSVACDKLGNFYITGEFDSKTLVFDSITLNRTGSYCPYIVKYNNSGKIIWTKTFGGGGSGNSTLITTDRWNNVYVAGYFSSTTFKIGNYTLTNGYGDNSMFLTKIDPQGNIVWAKEGNLMGSYGYSHPTGITVDNDGNVTVLADFTNDIILDNDTLKNYISDVYFFLVQYDSTGKVNWIKEPVYKWASSLGDPPESYKLCSDIHNNIIMTARYEPDLFFDTFGIRQSGYSFFIAKLNQKGNTLWVKTAGIVNHSKMGYGDITGLKTDKNCNIILNGGIDDSFRMDNVQINLTGKALTLKLDSNGKAIWGTVTEYPRQLSSYGIDVDKAGNIYECNVLQGCDSIKFQDKWIKKGYTAGSCFLSVVKFDKNGNFIWCKFPTVTALSSCSNMGNGCVLDTAENIYVSGNLQGYLIINKDTLYCPFTNGYYVFTLKLKNTLGVEEDVKNPICSGENNGEITLVPFAGISPIKYSWNTGQKTASITNLSPGAYIYTITDSTGCSYTDTVKITNPPLMSISISTKDEKNNNHQGEATVTVTGGVPPYTYLWNDPLNQKAAKATGLSSGNYKVTVTDNNGCIKDTTITIKNITSIEKSASDGINVYPNPVLKGHFFVEINQPGEKNICLDLYDGTGNKVFEKKYTSENKFIKDEIILNKELTGAYQLNISINNKTYTKELLFQ